MRILLAATAAALALAAGPAPAVDCTQRLRALTEEAPAIGRLPPDDRLLARRTLRDLRLAAHRLDADGLEAACIATLDALDQVMADYAHAVADEKPVGAIKGADDQIAGQAALDLREPPFVPLTAEGLSFDTRDLVGNSVFDASGDAVGEFEGVLTGQGGAVTHVLVHETNFWGIGGKTAAVPIGLVRWDPDNALFYMLLGKEQFEAAPEYDAGEGDWDVAANDSYYAGLQ